MADRDGRLLRRLGRRSLVLLGAAGVLWLGFGEPRRLRPGYHAEWLQADGIRTRAVRAGRGDTTLVFLHGYGESLLAWRLLLDRFTRHYRVLALDLPGFGLADKPATGYDYPRYERWLGQILTRYTTGPVVVVGHSMGGQLAAGLALDHPDRVVATVLIAPAGAGINPLLTDTDGVASPATRWVASAMSYVQPVHDPDWLRESADAEGYDPASDSAAANAARQVLTHFDFAALDTRWSELRQPTLLLWGRQDPTIPFAIGERMAATLPCRRFVPLFTLHRPHQSLPDTVAAEMMAFFRHARCE
jgi:pimeloyl-ACP methyl ester carboxylesterase